MTDKEQKKEDSAKTEIKKTYARLRDTLASAKQKRADMEAIITGEIVAPSIADWNREILTKKEELVHAASKEVGPLQADIRARRSLIDEFTNKWKKEVNDAQNDLDQFKQRVRQNNIENALFEQIELEELPEDEQKAAKKSKKGKQAKPSDNVTPIQATA